MPSSPRFFSEQLGAPYKRSWARRVSPAGSPKAEIAIAITADRSREICMVAVEIGLEMRFFESGRVIESEEFYNYMNGFVK